MRPLTPALLDVAPRVERRRRRTHRIDGEDLVGDGVARDVEPAPAALRVVPALEQQALGVVTQEDELRPFGVGEAGRVLRPLDVRLAAAMEFGLGARAAVGTDRKSTRLNSSH